METILEMKTQWINKKSQGKPYQQSSSCLLWVDRVRDDHIEEFGHLVKVNKKFLK